MERYTAGNFKAKLVRLQSQAANQLSQEKSQQINLINWFREQEGVIQRWQLPKVSHLVSWQILLGPNKVHCPIDKHFHLLHSDFHMYRTI